MGTIGDIRVDKMNILGYGAPMSGKTRFIRSLLKQLAKNKGVATVPAYIFNFDTKDNLLPLALDPSTSHVEYDQYSGPEGYEAMVKKIVLLKRECPYDLVVIENGGQLHKAMADYIMKINGRADSDGLRIQDWGLAAERVKMRLKEVLALPSSVYVTFHHQIEKDEIYGRATGRLLVPGKYLPEEIPPMFNMFLHFMISTKAGGGEPEYWVQCAGDNLWPAGDKTGSLSFKEEPDFGKMWEKIVKAKLSLEKGASK